MKDHSELPLLDPKFGRKLFWILVVICVGLGLSDLLYHKHTHYEWEGWVDFYGIYGFVGCVFLVLAARVLRKLVKRDEDYYHSGGPGLGPKQEKV